MFIPLVSIIEAAKLIGIAILGGITFIGTVVEEDAWNRWILFFTCLGIGIIWVMVMEWLKSIAA